MDVTHALKGHSSGLLMGLFWPEQRRFMTVEMFFLLSFTDKAFEKPQGSHSVMRRTMFSLMPRRCNRKECSFLKSVQRTTQKLSVGDVDLSRFFLLGNYDPDNAGRLTAGDFFQKMMIHGSHISSYMWFPLPTQSSRRCQLVNDHITVWSGHSPSQKPPVWLSCYHMTKGQQCEKPPVGYFVRQHYFICNIM